MPYIFYYFLSTSLFFIIFFPVFYCLPLAYEQGSAIQCSDHISYLYTAFAEIFIEGSWDLSVHFISREF